MNTGSSATQAPRSIGANDHLKYWVLFSVGVGNFMSTMDASIVNTLLPEMANSLHASIAAIEWVMTIYLLVLSGLLLAFGRMGDLRGHKNVYVSGYAVFLVSSGLCGLAPTVDWLIAFRALQAVASAMMFANSPAIVTSSFPPSERGRALGLQTAMTYVGYSAGPPLGGLLATHFGWRSVFFINVPIGLIGVFLSYRVIAHDRPNTRGPRFDYTGAVLIFIGLFALLFGLNQGYEWGWGSTRTLSVLLSAVIVLVAFVAVELRHEHPMLDLSLFRSRVFSGSVFSSLMNYTANSSIYFIVPFYLLAGRKLSPEHAGLILTALPVINIGLTPVAGTLSDRIGSRKPTAAGLLVLTAGLLLLSRLAAPIPLWQITAALVVCGVGFGLFVTPNNSRMLGAAPRNRQGIASGVLAEARCVGMVLGVGISGAIYTTVLHHRGPDAVPAASSLALKVIAVITAIAMFTSWMEGEAAAERIPQGSTSAQAVSEPAIEDGASAG
jgi:EmrB/QacA subfamily drug resistance transporter